MTLRALTAALLCVCTIGSPAIAEGRQCINLAAWEGAVTESGAQRLAPGAEARFRALYNSVPPATNYDGPVWVKDFPARQALVFVLAEDGKACIEMVRGDARAAFVAAINGR